MTAEGLSVPGETPTTPGSVRSVRFVIAVPDLARSSAYYRDVLGFEIHEIGDPGWRVYARDACTIFAGECPDAIPPTDLGDHSYFAYLVVDEIDASGDLGPRSRALILVAVACLGVGFRVRFGIDDQPRLFERRCIAQAVPAGVGLAT